MMNIQVGDVLFCCYGAMYPEYDYEVIEISENGKFCMARRIDDETDADVETMIFIEDIKPMGTTSANGSPIGVFLKESVCAQ